MEKLLIEGGYPISGTVVPSGNKNAALPLLAACLLTDEPVTLHNLPAIGDILEDEPIGLVANEPDAEAASQAGVDVTDVSRPERGDVLFREVLGDGRDNHAGER